MNAFLCVRAKIAFGRDESSLGKASDLRAGGRGVNNGVQRSWAGSLPGTPGKGSGRGWVSSMMSKVDRTNHLIAKMKLEQQSDDENLLNELWMPTFGYW